MSSDANKALVRRYAEMYHTGDLAIADAIIAADFVDHVHSEAPRGPEGVKQMVLRLQGALTDLEWRVEHVFAEGESVAMRFELAGTHAGPLGAIAPTGRRVTVRGVDVFRIAEGKLAELWSYQDTLGMLRQLGYTLVPPE